MLAQVGQRGPRRGEHGRGQAPDRLEREDDAFFDAIAGAYEALAAAEPERFRVLGARVEPAVVLAAARAALADLG